MLLIDTDPVMPTDKAVRAAIEKLAGNLGKAGVTVTRAEPAIAGLCRHPRGSICGC